VRPAHCGRILSSAAPPLHATFDHTAIAASRCDEAGQVITSKDEPLMDIRRIGFCLKEDEAQIEPILTDLVRWLEAEGLAVVFDENGGAVIGRPGITREALTQEVDLVVSLGGDGTLLSVARAAGTRSVPILGVNLGRLGFLTEVNIDEVRAALEKVLAGDGTVVPRMRLEVEAFRGGERLGHYHALNDAVLTRQVLSRMIDLEARADGVKVTTYHADGLIVSTPTGSTAYSLSAGGPLLLPGLEAIILTPICPHSLTQRPIVLPQNVELEIVVEAESGDAALTVDGQEGLDLEPGDRVVMHRSPHPVEIVASPFRDPYEILHTKLRWGHR